MKYVLFSSIFTVAACAGSGFLEPKCFGNSSNGRTILKTAHGPAQKFRTVLYTPPELEIEATGDPLAPGLLFLSPDNPTAKGYPEPGPVIMTSAGEMVWHSTLPLRADNFRTQKYKGKSVLTFWNGTPSVGKTIGHGYGAVEFLDDTYKHIRTVCPKINIQVPGNKKYPCYLDLHESQITSRNTILATAYDMRKADLSKVGGPKKGYVFAGMFYEIDPDTSKVLFAWDSLDHIPITATHLEVNGSGTKTDPFDYFHINSIQDIGNKYLINSRHTWSSYLLGPKGDIIWEFNGKTGGDFGPLPKGGDFHWAHYARIRHRRKNSFDFSIFNNNNNGADSNLGPTGGLLFTLPKKPGSKKVMLDRKVEHHPALRADVEGSYSPSIGNSDNQFMGYGSEPYMAEFTKAGKQIWSASFGKAAINYRAFKEKWQATPFSAPKLMVEAALSGVFCKRGYVSWNGATDITDWMIYAGKTAKTLKKLGPVKRHGFETLFTFKAKCVQAAAMRGKKIIKASNIVCKP